MANKNDYRQYLKQTLSGLVDQLEISDLRKEFIKNRWLDQLLWLEGKATKEQKSHYTLRLITIIGGVLVPAIVGFQKGEAQWQEIAGWTAFALSQAVAVSAALEEFFGHGEKYRHYRNTAEALKIEGWQYLQMTGPYLVFENHADAFPAFAERVEQYIRQDVQGFMAQLESSQAEGKKKAEDTAKRVLEQAADIPAQKLELRAQLETEQFELKARLEAQKRELEAERERLALERQKLEAERSNKQGATESTVAVEMAEESPMADETSSDGTELNLTIVASVGTEEKDSPKEESEAAEELSTPV